MGSTYLYQSRDCWFILFPCINYKLLIKSNGVNKKYLAHFLRKDVIKFFFAAQMLFLPALKFIPIFDQYNNLHYYEVVAIQATPNSDYLSRYWKQKSSSAATTLPSLWSPIFGAGSSLDLSSFSSDIFARTATTEKNSK